MLPATVTVSIIVLLLFNSNKFSVLLNVLIPLSGLPESVYLKYRVFKSGSCDSNPLANVWITPFTPVVAPTILSPSYELIETG